MGQPEQKLVAQFDKNKDDRLDVDERKAAREWLAENGSGGRGFGGGRRGGGRGMAPGTPGRALKPADVKSLRRTSRSTTRATLRTIFLQFENADWEQELAAFNNTDVEVPASAPSTAGPTRTSACTSAACRRSSWCPQARSDR